jgi:hypothetical protein
MTVRRMNAVREQRKGTDHEGRSRRPIASVRAMVCVGLLAAATACTSKASRTFDAVGVTAVVLRAAHATEATVRSEPATSSIRITGIPRGGARGYHSPNPGWRETPASRWGLDFVAKRYGHVLVISTENEIRYIHHGYSLDELAITVPAGVTVQRADRELTGDGRPDLSPPPRADVR